MPEALDLFLGEDLLLELFASRLLLDLSQLTLGRSGIRTMGP